MFRITAVAEDGQSVTFDASPSEDIITSALKQDIILLSSCREGGCATCKCEAAEGEYELRNCSVQALPPDEEEDRYVLLCRTYPRSDMEVRLPYTYDRISFETVNKEWRGEITGIEQLSSNVMRLTIAPSAPDGNPARIPFDAGQYMDIEVPGTGVWRSYSMATTRESGELEFLIRILPGGFFSNFLLETARSGMEVQMRGPSGAFAIRENGLRPRYFVAGGTGLSPVLAMIRYMREERHPQETKLFFGVTHHHELFYVEHLHDLAKSMPNLEVHIAVVNSQPGSDFSDGTVVDQLLMQLGAAKHAPDIYLCGPPGMIDATLAAARKHGTPPDQVFYEKFLPSGQVQAAE